MPMEKRIQKVIPPTWDIDLLNELHLHDLRAFARIATPKGLPKFLRDQFGILKHRCFSRCLQTAYTNNGDCDCRGPLHWYLELGCGFYHMDTPEGLEVLANTIRSLVSKHSITP